MTFSSFKIARATYRFVWGNRLECLRILWLPLLLMFFLAWIVWPHIAALLDVCVRAVTANSIAGSLRAGLALWLLLALAGFTVLGSIMCAGLWRFILRNVHVNRPFYLGFGSDELRLLILVGMRILLFAAWAAVTAAAAFLVEFVVSHYSGSISPSALLWTLLIAFLALGWMNTRLSLSGSATIQTQHVDLGSSWRAMAHNITRVQLVAALLIAPAAIVILVLILLALLLSIHWINLWACAQFLARFRYLLPILLLVLFFQLLFLAALFLTARALEYRELSTP